MLLSKRTQYGIRAMVYYADAYERGFLQARELSIREKLPPRFLESILNSLTRGKYLVSKIGISGGYRLARAPKEIMVGEIVAGLEGRRLMLMPEDEHPEETPGAAGVRLLQSRLTDAVRQVLDTTSLADLVEQVSQQNRRGQMYFI
jgi:Rrf2 family protein